MSHSGLITYSPRHMLWFDPFMRFYVRRRTNAVYVEGHIDWSPDAIHVLMPQHVGKLDGFLVRMIQRQDTPGARLVTIMLESQLKANPVLRKAGGFGITPGSASSGKDLLRMVRNDLVPGDCLVIFPQGRIQSVDADPTAIQQGFRSLLHPDIPTRFIPMALSVEALTHSKPSLFARVGDAVSCDEAGAAFAQTVNSLRAFMRNHGEAADTSWPGYRMQ